MHEGECPQKTKRDYRGEYTKASDSRVRERKFRSSSKWQQCRKEVLARDKHLCVICYKEEGFVSVHEKLDVHHIESLHKAWKKRCVEDNLITLCKRHHKLADNGEYTEEYLRKLVSPLPKKNKI